MKLLLLPLGLAAPACIGWCLLRLLEGQSPVLGRVERWVFGSVLGLTFTLFITFLAHIVFKVPFSRVGFLSVQMLLLALTVLPVTLLKLHTIPPAHSPREESTPRWAWILLSMLLFWTFLKILLGSAMLVSAPTYLDDTLSNWNLRGKLFYETKALTLILPTQRPDATIPSGISSYPPTVSMAKAWLADLAGTWDEGLANSIHLIWFLGALGIVFFIVRRVSSTFWGAVAVYLLACLPLYLIQGTNPYGDVFFSAHLASSVGLLFLAVQSQDRRERNAFLRLSAFATALLPFTKNEGLVLYLPLVCAVLAGSFFWMIKTKRLSQRDAGIALSWYLGLALMIIVPWIAFKMAHDLPFGNAKGIAGMELAWQPGVINAIMVNTFFEGNWLLLFPLLILLFIFCYRAAFFSPLAVFSAAFLLLYLGQMPIFMFTGLSTEALFQTGYARGLIHLMPILIMLTTLLLRDGWMRLRKE